MFTDVKKGLITFVITKKLKLNIHTIIDSNFDQLSVKQLKGRYITNAHILPLLQILPYGFTHEILGHSEQGKPIYGVSFGSGALKILAWSQMHGNESTCTKAIFDAIFALEPLGLVSLSEQITLQIIPILNPDGAECYTRLNSNAVDLNRDAKNLTQSESQLLSRIFYSFQPNFCFNMHDQRTIFSAGNQPKPATVSFLSPSENKKRTITPTRRTAMAIINQINTVLQSYIPDQIGRYSDEFNSNCVGDLFQSKGVPTVLFEAGHFEADYNREVTRKFILMAFLEALISITHGIPTQNIDRDYHNIPENEPHFFDVLIRNAFSENDQVDSPQDIGIMFEETLVGADIHFVPKIKVKGDLHHCFGHQTIDAQGQHLSENSDGSFKIGNETLKISI